MSLFGNNIHVLRKLNKWQQAEMPDIVGIGRGTWSDYENGRTEPNIEGLIKISTLFGISIDDLVKTNVEEEIAKGNISSKSDADKNGLKGNNTRNKSGNKKPYSVSKSTLYVAAEHVELTEKSSQKDLINAIKELQAALLQNGNK